MNAITTTSPAVSDQEIIDVLQSSLYPGAKPASIALVLSYCRVNQLDPMLKPVHIVPTSVKVGEGKWEMRDVLMPGISDYRVKAARSGEYVGKSEPMFGPDQRRTLGGVEVTYPLFCKITVQRYVSGRVAEFTAVEYWIENYATASNKTDAPNRMWLKRAYGQLAKCAEAQALRMAFPEFSGGVTAEEMEGKAYGEGTGPVIEGKVEEQRQTTSPRDQINKDVPINDQPKKMTFAQWLDGFEIAVRDCADIQALSALIGTPEVQWAMKNAKEGLRTRLEGIIAQGKQAHAPVTHEQDGTVEGDDDSGMWPGPAPEHATQGAQA